MDELGAILETSGIAAVELAASALAERGEQTLPCPNCGKPMIGPYCAVCGQPHNTHRRSLGRLVHEFVKDVVSFDSRILRTTRALLLRPGELPNAFREGRTQPYVPAVRLYLFVTLLFFLFLSATGLALVQFTPRVESVVYSHDAAGHVYKTAGAKRTLVDGLKSDKDGNVSAVDADGPKAVVPGMKADGKTVDNSVGSDATFFQPVSHAEPKHSPEMDRVLANLRKEAADASAKDSWIVRAITETVIKLDNNPAALNGPMTAWIPRILFVLLPLFAVLLALFYRAQRRKFLFVDHLVFSLTMHSFAFVVLIVSAILAQVISGGWVAAIAWALLSLYFFLSLKIFYRQGWGKTGVKFASISLVYFLFFLCPALGFAVVASVIWA